MSDEIKKELEESTEEVIVNEPALDETTVEEVVVEEEKPTEDVVVDSTEESEVVKEEGSEVGEESVEEPSVEAPDKTAEESTDEETEEKSEDEDEVKEEPTDETPEDSPVEAGEDIEAIKNELAQMKSDAEDAKMVEDFLIEYQNVDKKLAEVQSNVANSIEEVAKKYGIPTNISLEELEKQDPTKATMAREIMSRANQVLQRATAELNAERESKARDLVFKKAEKEFSKYELSQDQIKIAASTFVNIINQTGVQDLAEDLKAKVKLSVAQARMDSPVVAKVAEVAQEILDDTNPKGVPTAPAEEVKEEETKTDTTVSNELPPEIETEEEKVEEVKEEVPPTPEKDLSEYMEGASTSVQKAASVTVENVLEQLEALPFRERTAFYKEHQDVIDQAMALRRKDV